MLNFAPDSSNIRFQSVVRPGQSSVSDRHYTFLNSEHYLLLELHVLYFDVHIDIKIKYHFVAGCLVYFSSFTKRVTSFRNNTFVN